LWIQIQIRIQIQFWIKGFDDQFIKNCNLLNPRPPYRTPKLQPKPSAFKREHPALRSLEILYIFALLDPDPDPHSDLNPHRRALVGTFIVITNTELFNQKVIASEGQKPK
jgi:hypothetical protein